MTSSDLTIYFFHTITESFGDIGYHLLIDSAGVVYEGRYSGADKTPVFGPRSATGLARETKLDPLGQTNYVNPISGAKRTVKTISAHRDWNTTECPGNTFSPTLPALRREVAQAL